MTKEQLKDLGLNDVQIDGVLKLTENTIPYARFKELNDEKNEIKNQLSSSNEKLKELANIIKDNEELNLKIKNLETKNQEVLTEYEAKLSNLRLDSGIELALNKVGALNVKAVKSLLNLDEIKLENNNLVGLDEQITKLKETDGFLFKTENKETITPNGITPKLGNDLPIKPGIRSYTDILNEL